MKIRITTLATELQLSEGTLIHWLARRGYPGARGKDWLTPHLAESARRELSARVRAGSELRASYRSSSAKRWSEPLQRESPTRFSAPTLGFALESIETVSTRASEARTEAVRAEEIRAEEIRAEEIRAEEIRVDHQSSPLPMSRGSSWARGSAHDPDSVPSPPDLKRTDDDLDLLKRERTRAELLGRQLEDQRAHYDTRHHDLQRRYEQIVRERTQLRQTLYGMNQNQATLDQTCRELSRELEQTQLEVNELKRDLKAQEQISNSINQEKQQKLAWRARALELEVRVQTNQQLSAQLKKFGLGNLELQIRLFQTLLSTPESASQLFHAIKMVEQDEVKQMIERWVVQTCTHPMCQQINTLSRRLSLRVDRVSRCEVCQGDADLRWFKRLTVSCELAHVKRFLLVGADALHDKIRALTEGRAINFRLISKGDESSDQRIYSRLENSDLLVIWPHERESAHVTRRYYEIASQTQTPTLELPGGQPDLQTLARRSLNWVTRTGGHPNS